MAGGSTTSSATASATTCWTVPFDQQHGRLTGAASQVTRFTNPNHLLSPDLGSAEPSISRTLMILPIMERRGSIWMLDGVDR